mmetsp:Transcript_13234/g.15162  ORF Transcript_13234/g.15162 Transcript_13234/m.15162 type:complete len:463 (+) Transcript_13234:124-1512(+)|eukprot:CAMPEP_0194138110 /NCGR_PEP_ID=MMETSP0152-20130528/7955_1 /TAXON_ID=1049557 /ORGANISM="Thalassiothrix antarctica, Strain L6-D1" /LENGTH=462 /DNA_ID=CAMNT_0038835451 /DNA_START=124 /DNA_END=1512 /DNA_ORIENTATION=-
MKEYQLVKDDAIDEYGSITITVSEEKKSNDTSSSVLANFSQANSTDNGVNTDNDDSVEVVILKDNTILPIHSVRGRKNDNSKEVWNPSTTNTSRSDVAIQAEKYLRESAKRRMQRFKKTNPHANTNENGNTMSVEDYIRDARRQFAFKNKQKEEEASEDDARELENKKTENEEQERDEQETSHTVHSMKSSGFDKKTTKDNGIMSVEDYICEARIQVALRKKKKKEASEDDTNEPENKEIENEEEERDEQEISQDVSSRESLPTDTNANDNGIINVESYLCDVQKQVTLKNEYKEAGDDGAKLVENKETENEDEEADEQEMSQIASSKESRGSNKKTLIEVCSMTTEAYLRDARERFALKKKEKEASEDDMREQVVKKIENEKEERESHIVPSVKPFGFDQKIIMERKQRQKQEEELQQKQEEKQQLKQLEPPDNLFDYLVTVESSKTFEGTLKQYNNLWEM